MNLQALISMPPGEFRLFVTMRFPTVALTSSHYEADRCHRLRLIGEMVSPSDYFI